MAETPRQFNILSTLPIPLPACFGFFPSLSSPNQTTDFRSPLCHLPILGLLVVSAVLHLPRNIQSSFPTLSLYPATYTCPHLLAVLHCCDSQRFFPFWLSPLPRR